MYDLIGYFPLLNTIVANIHVEIEHTQCDFIYSLDKNQFRNCGHIISK